jgi:hypothetical protein
MMASSAKDPVQEPDLMDVSSEVGDGAQSETKGNLCVRTMRSFFMKHDITHYIL